MSKEFVKLRVFNAANGKSYLVADVRGGGNLETYVLRELTQDKPQQIEEEKVAIQRKLFF